MGRRRAVPGRQLRRRPLGRVERPVPRRRALVREERPGHRRGRSAQRFLGSPDIYGAQAPGAAGQTINFVTCHDGFTLNDLVSYDHKHNEANGEDEPRRQRRRTCSWNGGVEGPTDDPAIEALRAAPDQATCWPSILLCVGCADAARWATRSGGRRAATTTRTARTTRRSWFDWTATVERHADVPAFHAGASSALRRRWPSCCSALRTSTTLARAPQPGSSLEWQRRAPRRAGPGRRPRAAWRSTLRAERRSRCTSIFNAYWEPLDVRAAAARAGRRRLAADRRHERSSRPTTWLRRSAEALRGRAGRAYRGRRSAPWSVLARAIRAGRRVDAGSDADDERTPNASGWRTPATRRRAWRRPARGTSGGRTSPSAPGARSARTTAPTATRGPRSRTTTPARARTAGTRTGWPGMSDVFSRLCLALALWNGQDPILKERMFGLTNSEGNHGEDVKEYWWYLDAVPSSAWLRWRYHYPQAAFPYERPGRGERARGPSSSPSTSCSTPASSTTTATGSSRSTTRRRTRPTS